MLASLTIQNIVLIDRLTLDGDDGLLALTGETGAGKSILLDALGLALGSRAEAGLVRHGEEQATVTVCFDVAKTHPVTAFLEEKGIARADTLILRRTLGKDGRSKAFINDAPVGVQLLKETGAFLVEIHSQFETQGLLDPATHLDVLDEYTGNDTKELSASWKTWREAKERHEQALADIENLLLQEEYLRYAVTELERLDPQQGEEALLAEKRQTLLNRDKMAAAFGQVTEIVESDDGLRAKMGRLQDVLEKLSYKSPQIAPLVESLSRAQSEVDDIAWQMEKIKQGDHYSGERLEDVEERYFSLKECAKKHRVTVDGLSLVYQDLSQKLRLITHQEDTLAKLQKSTEAARQIFIDHAEKAGVRRRKAAQKLAKAVNTELPDLKLDKARFSVVCDKLENEKDWGPGGTDRVQFMVSTNPSASEGAIHKIASGGELSRFMLALKVILAETSSISTLIFDEVDSGIGGATADAVGERLQRLASKYQVLVVTHSPQVAARATHHWHVSKTDQKGTVITRIVPLLASNDRQEEIARMLSGAKVTKEARAQAAKLLENHVAA